MIAFTWRFRLLGTLAGLIVAGVLAATYLPGLRGGFFFDDEVNITEVESIRLEQLSTSGLRDALSAGIAGPTGRPVSTLSFALNHYFSGFDPFAFKATNLAIHCINGLLVFFLALLLMRSANREAGGHQTVAAAALALVWLLHPIQGTTVLYVVQRMTSLSALFLFAAMLAHVRGRQTGGLAGAASVILAWGVLWPLSIFSKETGALFPFFALAWELILWRSARLGLDTFARALIALAGMAAVAVTIYALSTSGNWLWAGYDLRTFSMAERLLTEWRVLWFYLGLIFFPRLDALGLYHDDITVSTSLFVPWTTLPALAGLAGLIWIACRLRRRVPLVSFGIAWFFLGHALESTVLPLEIAHEHRNYLPLFGILLAPAWALTRALGKRGLPKTFGVTFSIAFLAYACFLTLLRAQQYGEEVRRTQIESQHHPNSPRAHYDAGLALVRAAAPIAPESPLYALTRRHYELAGEIDPAFKLGWLGLVHLNCQAGARAEQFWLGELARRLRETPFAPGDRSTMYSVKEMSIAGTLCLNRTEVERLFSAAQSNPTATASVRAMLHSWLADYLTLSARDLPAAAAELDRSLALVPHAPSNRFKRAQLDFLLGRYAEAGRRLSALGDAHLSRSERETLAQLQTCLDSGDPAARCKSL